MSQYVVSVESSSLLIIGFSLIFFPVVYFGAERTVHDPLENG